MNSQRVVRVARAIAAALEYNYDMLPFRSDSYQYDQETLQRLARAAIRAMKDKK